MKSQKAVHNKGRRMIEKKYQTRCIVCGKRIKNGHLCSDHKAYFKSGATLHPLPKPGTMVYAKSGKMICHICGQEVDSLEQHLKTQHRCSMNHYQSYYIKNCEVRV